MDFLEDIYIWKVKANEKIPVGTSHYSESTRVCVVSSEYQKDVRRFVRQGGNCGVPLHINPYIVVDFDIVVKKNARGGFRFVAFSTE